MFKKVIYDRVIQVYNEKKAKEVMQSIRDIKLENLEYIVNNLDEYVFEVIHLKKL